LLIQSYMALKNQLQVDLVAAMKAKDDIKLNALRMVKAAILKLEVSGERKEATDDDILAIVNKEIKSRMDSAEQFRAGNRIEMAEKEEKEIEILKVYMPPQLGEDQILELAKAAIAQTGATKKHDMGKVMAALMPKVKGMADGNVVNKIVSALLE
jgi:uncharacterized protein YqeY